MFLRALQDASNPWITRTQYAGPCHGRQLLLFVHKLAHTLGCLFVPVPRDAVSLIGVVSRQFLQVLLNTVPALGPNGFAFVHERKEIEMVSFDRVLDLCLLPCIGKVRSRYSTTLHVKGEQPRIVLVDWIEQLRIFIPNITMGTDPCTSRTQREESTFLAVSGIPTDPEVLPIEREPPIPLIRSAVDILCRLLRSVVFNIPVAEAVFRFREPALLV